MDEPKMSKTGVGPLFGCLALILSGALVWIHLANKEKYLIRWLSVWVASAVSAVFIVVGLFLWCSSAFKIFESIETNTLNTSGAYGIVRNPIYSGIFHVLTGILIMFRSYIVLPAPFIIYGMLRYLVTYEEEELLKRFGDEFIEYKKQVNAVFPTLRKLFK